MIRKNMHAYLILMDPCIVDYSVEIPTRCSFVIEFIIPLPRLSGKWQFPTQPR